MERGRLNIVGYVDNIIGLFLYDNFCEPQKLDDFWEYEIQETFI